MFRDTTITRDASGGSVTFQIDGNPSFTAQAKTDTTRSVLVVPLANTPGPVMTAFLHQLVNGSMWLPQRKHEPLSGSNPALVTFSRCIVAMSSDSDQRP